MERKTNSLISYDLIKKALDGDTVVINQIRDHYRPYFSKLAIRVIKDKSGKKKAVVDEVLRGRLETKLLITILRFEIKK